MNSKWMLLTKKADFAGIGKELDIDPVVVRVMRNRGLKTAEQMRSFLALDTEDGITDIMHDPMLLPDMDKAVLILAGKVKDKKHIRVVGDYDVDGVTASYILVKSLKQMGAKVSYAIPDRMTDGYGINTDMVESAYEDGVDTLLTCDNGIAAFEAMELAKGYGMTCIVTDHHEVPFDDLGGDKEYKLPPADAIVDPKRMDSIYPYKEICGAMVAYKLVLALNEHLIGDGENEDEDRILDKENTDELLTMAGLATVCDMMELMDENRAVVKKALKLMDNTSNTGLKALIRVCGIDKEPMNTYKLGFVIGPCINSTGRLENASLSLKLLLEENYEEATKAAVRLKNLNDSRKAMTEDGIRLAMDHVEKNGLYDDKVIVVYLPGLHESLAGIVAGRIKEKFYKPTLVFTDSEDGIKGSGRSVEGYDMYEELNRYKSMYIKFGGHKMAAGLTVKRTFFDDFKAKIVSDCTLTDDDLTEKIYIDAAMPFSYVSERLIHDMYKLEPFGLGNARPLFAQKNVCLRSARILGKNGSTCKIFASVLPDGWSQDSGGDLSGLPQYELILFKDAEGLLKAIEDKYGSEAKTGLIKSGSDRNTMGPGINIMAEVTYCPDINEYNGNRSIQYVIKNYHI